MTQIKVTRVYDDPAGVTTDGYRVFVDRLWPRGESKEKFHYDLWAKEVAPSTALREWFHENPSAHRDAFRTKYTEELAANPAVPGLIADLRKHAVVTLLYSSRDTEQNNADVLADYLCSTAGFTR